jgi:hypothetical protein
MLNLFDKIKLEIPLNELSNEHEKKIIDIIMMYQWELESEKNIISIKHGCQYDLKPKQRYQKIKRLNELKG